MNFEEAKRIFIGFAEGELSEPIDEIKNEADGGSGVAAYYLAEAYAFGRGAIKDEKKAFEIANVSAEIFPPAKAVVAYDYFCGRGVDKNVEKGLQLFREAANCGCITADMFLSDNRDCKNYAIEQFSKFMSRKEKILRLKSINDDMAKSMLYVYSLSNPRKIGQTDDTDKFSASGYRYAKTVYLAGLALSQKNERDKTLAELEGMAKWYAYAYDLLGDIYRSLGDELSSAGYYAKAFRLGVAASGTKFVLIVQAGAEIGDDLVDEFISVAYKFSREGHAYAGFLLAYYYDAVVGYNKVAAELFKAAACNGSPLAERILKLKNLTL